MEKYQNKQENLLEEICHFLEPGKFNNVGDGKFSEFVKKVEEQMSKLTQKVSVLAQAKTDVDHRWDNVQRFIIIVIYLKQTLWK